MSRTGEKITQSGRRSWALPASGAWKLEFTIVDIYPSVLRLYTYKPDEVRCSLLLMTAGHYDSPMTSLVHRIEYLDFRAHPLLYLRSSNVLNSIPAGPFHLLSATVTARG